ncbi:LysR family transcriptional regulator [Peterkaempfera sp. SMS 1(5)a]|uniref:helix-turn-helix domain-containing protein n=1 Tax=Peterkaempfera podocarpi TaxID=3232308 RepID=UPI003670D8C8
MPSVPSVCSAGTDVEPRRLRAFVAVARPESFTRAAQQPAITRPAPSRTVRRLAATVRVTL